MMRVFADSSYYLALLSADDEFHEAAKRAAHEVQGRLITTAWVLTEVADAFCRPGQRQTALQFIRSLQTDPRVTVVAAEQTLFDDGLDFYAERPDKEWSLTDCISFVVMRNRGLSDALTTDHHFEQAGFNALLKQGRRR